MTPFPFLNAENRLRNDCPIGDLSFFQAEIPPVDTFLETREGAISGSFPAGAALEIP